MSQSHRVTVSHEEITLESMELPVASVKRKRGERFSAVTPSHTSDTIRHWWTCHQGKFEPRSNEWFKDGLFIIELDHVLCSVQWSQLLNFQVLTISVKKQGQTGRQTRAFAMICVYYTLFLVFCVITHDMNTYNKDKMYFYIYLCVFGESNKLSDLRLRPTWPTWVASLHCHW